MREIKFRAWDNDTKKMCEDFLYFVEDAIFQHQGNPWQDQRFTPMQFTGLKDKNGMEIFEGDIVTCGERVGIKNLLRRVKGEVIYVESAACFCVNIPDEDDGYIGWEFEHYSNFEVIGNIYENHELLKLPPGKTS